MKKILFAIALAVVATACQNSNEGGDVQFGKIAINAATRGEVSESEAQSRFVLPENLMPSANDLKVEIVGNNNTYTWATLAEFNAANEEQTFASAPYTITLSYGEKGAEGWSKPYFEGSTSVEVPMYGLAVDANIEVLLANSIVAIETTDNFNGYFPKSAFKINNIEWESAKGEMLFMSAGEVTISCEAERQTGSKTSLETKLTLNPTTRYTVVFDLSTAGKAVVNVMFDDEIVDTIELEFELNDKA